ncbi:hypothetical protein Dimus_002698, partial [Dionaea muscipula]
NAANTFKYYRRDPPNPAAIANDSATALTTPNVEPNQPAIANDSATVLATHPPLVNDPNVEPNPRQLGQRRRRARERVERLVHPLSETHAVVHPGQDTPNPPAITNDSIIALATHPPLVVDPNVEPNQPAIANDSATTLMTHPPFANEPNVEPNPRQLGQRRRRARERVERLSSLACNPAALTLGKSTLELTFHDAVEAQLTPKKLYPNPVNAFDSSEFSGFHTDLSLSVASDIDHHHIMLISRQKKLIRWIDAIEDEAISPCKIVGEDEDELSGQFGGVTIRHSITSSILRLGLQ